MIFFFLFILQRGFFAQTHYWFQKVLAPHLKPINGKLNEKCLKDCAFKFITASDVFMPQLNHKSVF